MLVGQFGACVIEWVAVSRAEQPVIESVDVAETKNVLLKTIVLEDGDWTVEADF
jgi:hypothetical protein